MQNVSSKSLKKIGDSVLFGALIFGGTGCATTINLSAPTTLAQPSVTTLPTGTTVELYEQLKATLSDLSLAITNEDKPRAKTTLATVLNIWGALKPQIESAGGETVEQTVSDMQRIVDLASSSVQRTRPADADKAVRFLDLIIQSQ
jgi:flagellin-specific chaperone FliS